MSTPLSVGRRCAIAGLLSLAIVPGVLVAQSAATRPRTVAEDLQLFSQVYNQIRVNHPDSLDSHRLFLAAIQALVRATDPHSYVIPSVRLQPGKAEQLREGRFHPVPIDFAFVGGSAVVSTVYAGTAARQQGILPGDELVLIDGEPMQAESALELEILLAGPRGSNVALTFERRREDGTYERVERRVKRERFSEESAVPATLMLDEHTGYVRITTFVGDRVAADLRRSLQTLEGAGMQRLLLDLRQNGGGSVDEAATIAGEFLPTGAVIYTSESRRADPDTGRVRRSFFRSERRYPIVVLIDEGTASASELVAGALQDHDRALIVGQPSFGKSLMMRGFPLSDGSVLVLVVGRLKTPCGRVLQREYREVTARNYYRLAAAERDTVGRPTCQTTGGRTVYGGGGIYPDVRTERAEPMPAWLRRVNTLDLPLTWVGSHVGSAGSALDVTAEQFAAAAQLPDGAMASFRALATERGVTVPTTPEAEAALQRLLLGTIAYAKWGSAGLYQVEARLDPAVRDALRHFSELEGRGIR